MPTTTLTSLESNSLELVTGGAARVTGRGGAASSELTTMLTQIGSSVKDLAGKKDDGPDMSMMMMMMMMGGGGGGGSAPAPAPVAPTPPPAPVINISNSIRR